MVIGWAIAATVVGIEMLIFGAKLDTEGIAGTDEMKKWYIPIFLARALTVSVLYSFSFWLPLRIVTVILIIFESLYLLILLIGLPYSRRCFSTLTIIFNQITSLYGLGLVIIYRVAKVNSSTEILMWLAMEVLLVLICTFCGVRITHYYWQCWKNNKEIK